MYSFLYTLFRRRVSLLARPIRVSWILKIGTAHSAGGARAPMARLISDMTCGTWLVMLRHLYSFMGGTYSGFWIFGINSLIM